MILEQQETYLTSMTPEILNYNNLPDLIPPGAETIAHEMSMPCGFLSGLGPPEPKLNNGYMPFILLAIVCVVTHQAAPELPLKVRS